MYKYTCVHVDLHRGSDQMLSCRYVNSKLEALKQIQLRWIQLVVVCNAHCVHRLSNFAVRFSVA
eukprot:m.123223 g.123223  ORF g.123223 m.123223 type:complete len:64 (+) comp22005_c0_seq2:759-950(+)